MMRRAACWPSATLGEHESIRATIPAACCCPARGAAGRWIRSASTSPTTIWDAARKLAVLQRGRRGHGGTDDVRLDAVERLTELTHRDAMDAVLADYDLVRDLADQLTALQHHGQAPLTGTT